MRSREPDRLESVSEEARGEKENPVAHASHLQALFAPDELRVLVVLLGNVDDVHPVALIVQGGSRSDELELRGAQGDHVRIGLPLGAIALELAVAQQRIRSIAARRYLAALRIPGRPGRKK